MPKNVIDNWFGLGDNNTPMPGGTTRARSAKALRTLHDDPDVLTEPMVSTEEPEGPHWSENRYYMRRKSVDGVTYTFYTIGALSEAIGHPIVTIRKWERKKQWPQATVRAGGSRKPAPMDKNIPAGDRLYTKEQIEAIVAVVLRLGMSPGTIRTSQQLYDAVNSILETVEGAT